MRNRRNLSPRYAARMIARWLEVLATVATAAVGTACIEPTALAPRGARGDALWSEFLDDDAVRSELDWLRTENADLYLAIHAKRIGDPGLAAVIREAAAADVGVRAWLLLDEDDGYWPNEHNVPATRKAALRLADWRDDERLPLDWIVLDLEMPLERSRAISELLRAGGAPAAVEAIKAGRDPAAFATHRAELSTLVDDLRARHFKVAAVTYPMVLDDLVDGDDDIQDGLDAPVFGPKWDEVAFMVYQSLLHDLSGSWHGPDLIYSYATSAREAVGSRAAVALGIVGSAGIEPVAMPYPDAATLVADRGAARAAGIDLVSVYSLDGLRPLEPVARDPWMLPGNEVKPAQVDAEGLRSVVRALLD